MPGAVRAVASRAWHGLRRRIGHPETRGWAPHSRLLFRSDHPDWVLAYEAQQLSAIATRLGIRTADPRLWPYVRHQAVFYGSHLNLLLGPQVRQPNRLATAYLHGRPGSGHPEFDLAFETLRRHHRRLSRVQVSHREMERVVLESGIDPAKVARIPLGVEPRHFPRVTPEARRQARRRFDIPDHALVIGSFQKDGVGWGEGREPKFIKGPDVLLAVVDQLRQRITGLLILLSGPARGYVIDGLTRMGVAYRHAWIEDPSTLAPLYHAIDLYLVTSRQEGGPKAVLEAMAAGVPVVTTRVGQAMDLVRHGDNGWMVGVDEVDGLTRWAAHVLEAGGAPQAVLDQGHATAMAHTYEAQAPLWDRFFDGWVTREGAAGR
jgi:glycosyltransferase involved in cell wall biosynthesis